MNAIKNRQSLNAIYYCFREWFEDECYIVSDTHFNDCNMKKYFNILQPDEIVNIINSSINKKSTLIILGDIGDISYISKIEAKRKILIKGNHDKGNMNYQRHIWSKKFDVNKSIWIADECLPTTKENIIHKYKLIYPNYSIDVSKEYDVQHAPFEYYKVTIDNHRFDEIYEAPVMIGKKLILSHEPVNVEWAYNIHGHEHDIDWEDDDHHMCVCAEKIGYKPINLNQWLKQSGCLGKIKDIHQLIIEERNKEKINKVNKVDN
jgi:calcineurin-like phosphoesterase family protein